MAMGRNDVGAAVRDLVALCHDGLDATSLMTEFAVRLERVLAVDAVFCASVDPATLLFTGAVLHGIPAESTPRFLQNEFLENDVNKFTALASRRFPVESLDGATSGDRTASPRYTDIMAPLGLGDELRAAMRSGGQCWGVVCLHRADGPQGFTAADARVMARVSAHLGAGLRRALLVDAAAGAAADVDAPGVLLVGDDGSLVATTTAGERWLWQLSASEDRGGRLPLAVESVLARLAAIRMGTAPSDVEPRVRVRTRSGRWAVLHAAPMAGRGRDRSVAVVVEAAKPAEMAPTILLAHGLTPREAEVAQLALQGAPTKSIARRLHISQNTVEDHLKAIFDKTGVGSRGELAAQMFSEHYAK